MNRLTFLMLAGFLILGAAAPLRAAEVLEANIQTVEVAEAPFSIQILEARWEEQEDGSYSLAVDYEVENPSEDSLAAFGWSLAAEAEDGTPLAYLSQIEFHTVASGAAKVFHLAIPQKSLAGAGPSSLITLGGTASSSQRCPGTPVDCNTIKFACEMRCQGTPLGTPRKLGPFSCGNCRPFYNNQKKCWDTICDVSGCYCEPALWPDQMPALDVFFDLDPILESYPGEPWPFVEP